MLRREARRETHEPPNEAKARRPPGCLRAVFGLAAGAFVVVFVFGLLLGLADTYLWRPLNWSMPFGPHTSLGVANHSGHPVRITHLRFAYQTSSPGPYVLETKRAGRQSATRYTTGMYALPHRYRFPVEIVYTEIGTGTVRRGAFTADRRPAEHCGFDLTLTPDGPRLTECRPIRVPYGSSD